MVNIRSLSRTEGESSDVESSTINIPNCTYNNKNAVLSSVTCLDNVVADIKLAHSKDHAEAFKTAESLYMTWDMPILQKRFFKLLQLWQNQEAYIETTRQQIQVQDKHMDFVLQQNVAFHNGVVSGAKMLRHNEERITDLESKVKHWRVEAKNYSVSFHVLQAEHDALFAEHRLLQTCVDELERNHQEICRQLTDECERLQQEETSPYKNKVHREYGKPSSRFQEEPAANPMPQYIAHDRHAGCKASSSMLPDGVLTQPSPRRRTRPLSSRSTDRCKNGRIDVISDQQFDGSISGHTATMLPPIPTSTYLTAPNVPNHQAAARCRDSNNHNKIVPIPVSRVKVADRKTMNWFYKRMKRRSNKVIPFL